MFSTHLISETEDYFAGPSKTDYTKLWSHTQYKYYFDASDYHGPKFVHNVDVQDLPVQGTVTISNVEAIQKELLYTLLVRLTSRDDFLERSFRFIVRNAAYHFSPLGNQGFYSFSQARTSISLEEVKAEHARRRAAGDFERARSLANRWAKQGVDLSEEYLDSLRAELDQDWEHKFDEDYGDD